MKRSLRRRKGFTLVEVLVAAGISTLALFSATAVFITGMSSWAKGQGQIDAETNSQRAVRTIANELRQAMSVFPANDGMSLDYRLPQLDGNGDYVIPIVWDGIDRSIYYQNGEIKIEEDGVARVICRNVETLDYGAENEPPYQIFTPAPGAITRQMTIQIVTRTNGAKDEMVVGRKRETIYLRNIPELTR